MVFFVKLFITIKKITFNKNQIKITLEFIYIKYKIERIIFKSIILSLQFKTSNKSIKHYKQFYSTYLQLFRL